MHDYSRPLSTDIVLLPNSGAAAARRVPVTAPGQRISITNNSLVPGQFVFVLFGDVTVTASAVAFDCRVPFGSEIKGLDAGANTHVSVFAAADFAVDVTHWGR
jgi:hypothetical protein